MEKGNHDQSPLGLPLSSCFSRYMSYFPNEKESLYVSGKLPTYPYHKPTLTLTSHLGQNLASGRGGWETGQFFDFSFVAVRRLLWGNPPERVQKWSGKRSLSSSLLIPCHPGYSEGHRKQALLIDTLAGESTLLFPECFGYVLFCPWEICSFLYLDRNNISCDPLTCKCCGSSLSLV